MDVGRSKSCPLNFVRILPVRIGKKEIGPSAFEKTFGEKSVEQRKALLAAVLESDGGSIDRGCDRQTAAT